MTGQAMENIQIRGIKKYLFAADTHLKNRCARPCLSGVLERGLNLVYVSGFHRNAEPQSRHATPRPGHWIHTHITHTCTAIN